MMRKTGIYCFCLFFTVTTMTVGCNEKISLKTDAVSGVITMDGSPLAGAIVTFSPTENTGHVASGVTDAGGKYVLQTLLGDPDAGTTPGNYIVSVSKKENVPTGKQEMSASEGKMVEIMESKERVPAKFTGKKTSPLKAAVVSGEANSFDFDVSK
jgi:hypothetical protein